MAEVLVEFSNPVKADDGRVFVAQACGSRNAQRALARMD